MTVHENRLGDHKHDGMDVKGYKGDWLELMSASLMHLLLSERRYNGPLSSRFNGIALQ